MTVRNVCLRCMVSLCAVFALNFVAPAAAPWNKLNFLRHVPADPDAEYSLTDANGPWLIMAATFSGDGADQQAHQLALALRRDYNLPAYTYERTFDYSKPVTGVGYAKPTAAAGGAQQVRPKQMRYLRFSGDRRRGRAADARSTEIAVMVGDYRAVDDRQAQKDLEKIKSIHPEVIGFKNLKTTNQQFALLRADQMIGRLWVNHQKTTYNKLKDPSEQRKATRLKGPMGHAFIVANPLLPEEAFHPKGVDRAVETFNKPFEHSLLNCSGKYTVQVASFTGNVVLDPKKIQQFERGGKLPSRLGDAARDAHTVCLALRELGYEAYEFHRRDSSIVTVGSFDSIGTRQRDGRIRIDAKIEKVMETFGAGKLDVRPGAGSLSALGNNPQGRLALAQQPQMVKGIPLDLQSKLIEVPRRSIGADYVRRPASGQ